MKFIAVINFISSIMTKCHNVIDTLLLYADILVTVYVCRVNSWLTDQWHS